MCLIEANVIQDLVLNTAADLEMEDGDVVDAGDAGSCSYMPACASTEHSCVCITPNKLWCFAVIDMIGGSWNSN